MMGELSKKNYEVGKLKKFFKDLGKFYYTYEYYGENESKEKMADNVSNKSGSVPRDFDTE